MASNVFDTFETNQEIDDAQNVVNIQHSYRIGKKISRWFEAVWPRSVMIKFASHNHKAEVWKCNAQFYIDGSVFTVNTLHSLPQQLVLQKGTLRQLEMSHYSSQNIDLSATSMPHHLRILSVKINIIM